MSEKCGKTVARLTCPDCLSTVEVCGGLAVWVQRAIDGMAGAPMRICPGCHSVFGLRESHYCPTHSFSGAAEGE
jgi:hypothetical protein